MEGQLVETWAIHNRIAPELLVGLSKVDKLDSNDWARLRTSLEASGATVGELLRSALAAGGRRPAAGSRASNHLPSPASAT